MNNDNSRYSPAKALFLGPKAENAELIEKLLIECFRDHCFWRRNFHPEDGELIGETEKLQAPFLQSSADLRQHLNQLMARLKRGSPNYHPRYLGHMHTDLMIAGILGQFATVFYTQNNVTPESAPVTARLELDVIRRIAEMIGYDADEVQNSRGHICSGGTVANIEAIWAARNIRHTPISLALGMRERLADPNTETRWRTALDGFHVPFLGQTRLFRDLTTVQLLNLDLPTVLGLRERLADALGSGSPTPADFAEAEQLLRCYSPEELGQAEVNRRLVAANLRPLSDYPWVLYVSTTKHYSFEKIADVLGLGRRSLRLIGIRQDFSMDVEQLEETIHQHVLARMEANEPCELPLAVIAVMGSTEEGALDDLPALLAMRQRLQQHGLALWLHTDAAYGGYALAMLRSRQHKIPPDADRFFSQLAGNDLAYDPLVKNTWTQSFHRLRGIAETESVTIDPHKMGYLPYPAGVILFRDGRTKMAVGCEVPYLFDRPEEEHFPGRYTLEGSRPGHVAAGVYLAHEVLPLDQEGHGLLVGRSLLGGRDIFVNTCKAVNDLDADIALRFICPPALNILNYIVSHRHITTLADQNALTNLILQEMSAGYDLKRTIPDFDFFAVSTTLDLHKYGHVLNDWLANANIEVTADERQSGGLLIFRSVIMHHHFLGARTQLEGKEVPLWYALAHYLVRVCRDKVARLQAQKSDQLYRAFPRRARLLLVEPEPTIREMLRQLLCQQSGRPFEIVLAQSDVEARTWFHQHDPAYHSVEVLIIDEQLSSSVLPVYRQRYGPTAPVLMLAQGHSPTSDAYHHLAKQSLATLEGQRRFVADIVRLINQLPHERP